MKTLVTIFSLFLLIPAGGEDIIMRHDVDEAKYFELAEKYGATAIRLNAGVGTFIQPDWIITASHVCENPEYVGKELTINGKVYPIKKVVMHPDFGMNRGISNDIALIQLESKVPGVKLAKLYNKSDEVGKEIVFVGTGYAGTGDKGMADGAVNKDRKLRAAQNKVDGTEREGFIRFTFDSPDSGKALPLEGISGPGDSGGPALWFDGDQAYIMGVSSHQDGRGMGKPEGRYGVWEYYARVSDYVDWVEGVVAGK
ncbi:MAG: trypsin-like serine protease [Roseivirga sp.]|nr:trypsin-like serine protease [Roseivirga sp.]